MAHKSTASKRGAMRAAPEEDPEFQIAPMIDILLVLLVFFMSISTTEVLQTNDNVKLPVARDAQEQKKGENMGQTVVNVLWAPLNNSGSIDIDNRPFGSPAEIVPLLKDKLSSNPTMRVLVRADKQVRYEYMRALLKAVGEAGVGNITFAVVNQELAEDAEAGMASVH